MDNLNLNRQQTLGNRSFQLMNRQLLNDLRIVAVPLRFQLDTNEPIGKPSNQKLGPIISDLNVLDSFKEQKYSNRQLVEEETFFKYHGIENRTGKKFSWLVKKTYESEASLRTRLAILPDWGVEITLRSTFKVPAGTWVSEGLTAAQRSFRDLNLILPGGDYQCVITNVRDAWIIKTVKAFP